MRSTLLPSGGLHLHAGPLDPDIDLTKAVVQDFLLSSPELDPCLFIHSLPDLIGTFQRTIVPALRDQARVVPRRTLPHILGQSLGFGEEHKNILEKFWALAPPSNQMGGEGILVKSKSLYLGPANNSMGKMDLVASNGSKQPKEADDVGVGVAEGLVGLGGLLGGLPLPSHEPSPEAIRRSLRKVSNHGNAPAQTSCIRQILLLQLGLIEQQQQQLHSKNDEISALKAEKEMLMARIERMEWRLQQTVTKKKVDPRTPQAPVSATAQRKEPEALVVTTGAQQGGLHTSSKQPFFTSAGKGHKRRLLCQEPRVGRYRRGGGVHSNLHRSVVLGGKDGSANEEPMVKEEEAEENVDEEEEADHDSFSGQSSPASIDGLSAVALELVPKMQELPYLATTDMYLCCWRQPLPASCSPWKDPSPMQDDTVDVPSWRENTVSPLTDKEAANMIENVEDIAFRKRHTKLEQDEKRRKRWDIQRIREQRIFQRLQQRLNKKKAISEPEAPLTTFYPDAEEVQSITITPFLPVVAFGRPLPNITPQSFELPHLIEHDRVCCRPEVSVKKKKKTPHRTCRK